MWARSSVPIPVPQLRQLREGGCKLLRVTHPGLQFNPRQDPELTRVITPASRLSQLHARSCELLGLDLFSSVKIIEAPSPVVGHHTGTERGCLCLEEVIVTRSLCPQEYLSLFLGQLSQITIGVVASVKETCLLVVLEAKVCNEGVGRDMPPATCLPPHPQIYTLHTHTHSGGTGGRLYV